MSSPSSVRDQIRQRFRARGETIRDWAAQHGFPEASVYAVLSGRLVGNRGTGHQIAIALGIKAPVAVEGTAYPQGGI